MKCREVRGLLEEWLDGELGDAARAEVERHLRSCEDCDRWLSDRRRLGASLGETFARRTAGLRFRAPDLSLLRGSGRSARPMRRPRPSPAALLALAASLVLVLFFAFHPWTRPRPESRPEKTSWAVITVSDSLGDVDESFISGCASGVPYFIHMRISPVKAGGRS